MEWTRFSRYENEFRIWGTGAQQHHGNHEKDEIIVRRRRNLQKQASILFAILLIDQMMFATHFGAIAPHRIVFIEQ